MNIGIETTPVWQQTVTYFKQGHSVLVTMPRYGGGGALLKAAAASFSREERWLVRPVKLDGGTPGNDFDYRAMITSITGLAPRGKREISKVNFEILLANWLKEVDQDVLLLVGNPGVGREREYFALMGSLHHVSASAQKAGESQLFFIAIDDYSLWYFENYEQRIDLSELWTVRRVMTASLSADDIESWIASLQLDAGPHGDRVAASRVIRDLSGGHLGLVAEAMAALPHAYGNQSSLDVDKLSSILSNGPTMEGIRRDLREDPIGLAVTAVEFLEPKYAVEYASPRFRTLRRLGILKWESDSTVSVCEGLIRRFIESLSAQTETTRIGSIVSSAGITLFDPAELKVSDDDIVILQLSDLHIGSSHAFRIESGVNLLNEGQSDLVTLISEDIAKLGLSQRIDGIVVSGDLTTLGSVDEFRAARKFLADLLGALSVRREALLVIPGNHDVEWDSKSFFGEGAKTSASLANFRDMLELAALHPFTGAAVVVVPSRSGKRSLQLVGLDSNRVESRDAAGIGFIGREAFEAADQILARSADHEGHRWIVVHHHVFPVSPTSLTTARGGRVSVMADAAELLSRARNWNAELILHGHEHQPVVTWARRWTAELSVSNYHPVAVVGAGSCGSRREDLGPFARNQYYLLIKKDNNVLVRSRALGEEGIGFVAHSDFSLQW